MSKDRIRTPLGCLIDIVPDERGNLLLIATMDDIRDDRRWEVLLDKSTAGKLYRLLGKKIGGRSRAAAKAAGSWLEITMTAYLQRVVDERIFRQTKTGRNDLADIGGVRIHGQKLAVECKNEARAHIPQWLREAETERGNLDALAGVVIAKRAGSMKPEDQLVIMTAGEFVSILTGSREHYDEPLDPGPLDPEGEAAYVADHRDDGDRQEDRR